MKEWICSHLVFMSIVFTILSVGLFFLVTYIAAAILTNSGSFIDKLARKVDKALHKNEIVELIAEYTLKVIVVIIGIAICGFLIYAILLMLHDLYGWWVLHICTIF